MLDEKVMPDCRNLLSLRAQTASPIRLRKFAELAYAASRSRDEIKIVAQKYPDFPEAQLYNNLAQKGWSDTEQQAKVRSALHRF